MVLMVGSKAKCTPKKTKTHHLHSVQAPAGSKTPDRGRNPSSPPPVLLLLLLRRLRRLRRQQSGMSLYGALRNIVRPLCTRRFLLPSLQLHHESPSLATSFSRFQPAVFFNPLCISPLRASYSTSIADVDFRSLTETRYPKRRPGMKPRRKRASLKPSGPHAWIQYVPGEPIPRSRPNEGSVQGRNRSKRIKQRKEFILSEEKKRKAQYAAFRKKRDLERIERKMAAVARERAWAERLVELQRLDAEKKAAKAAMA